MNACISPSGGGIPAPRQAIRNLSITTQGAKYSDIRERLLQYGARQPKQFTRRASILEFSAITAITGVVLRQTAAIRHVPETKRQLFFVNSGTLYTKRIVSFANNYKKGTKNGFEIFSTSRIRPISASLQLKTHQTKATNLRCLENVFFPPKDKAIAQEMRKKARPVTWCHARVQNREGQFAHLGHVPELPTNR